MTIFIEASTRDRGGVPVTVERESERQAHQQGVDQVTLYLVVWPCFFRTIQASVRAWRMCSEEHEGRARPLASMVLAVGGEVEQGESQLVEFEVGAVRGRQLEGVRARVR